MTRPAAFLDRDGTLMEDAGFVGDPARISVLPTAAEALRLLEAAGYARIVVSNQSGVARKYFTAADVERVHAELAARLARAGGTVDAWYFCTHYDDGCDCRKPAPGMIRRAVAEHDLALPGSVVVGDRGSDIALAHGVGIPGILLPSPEGMSYDGPTPDFTAATLLDAAHWIVSRDARD
jgi:histidinol-phosphate phosphatase family protein